MLRTAEQLGHEGCEREPIHIPGSIQPYGLLFVVDEATDLILQAAGDTASLMGYRGQVLRHTVKDVFGESLAELILHSDAILGREPVFVGTVQSSHSRSAMVIVAHRVQGLAVIEALPSTPAASAAKALADIRSITERIATAARVIEAGKFAACEVRRITGYDRVLVYQFLRDGSGSVIAEANDSELPQLLNHRFPAADIPAQARELYRRNSIRTIPDVGYLPAVIEPPRLPLTKEPLDMSHCLLRSVSPVHVQYLKNMAVGASMSVSLLPGSGLWGLVVGHNIKPREVSYEAQEACRHVGQILSQHIRAREESRTHRMASDLSTARDRVMRLLFAASDPEALLQTLAPELQPIVPSHGAAIVGAQTIGLTGSCPTEPQVQDLYAWLSRRMPEANVFATDSLADLYPPARAFAAEASGLVALRLPGDEAVILMWFRAEQVQEINWAGNPHEQLDRTPLGALNPRKSFATWRQTVRDSARPWEAVEIESAELLAPRLAFVLQQKRVRELNRLLGEANERLAALAAQDGLTGIFNRRAFDERLQSEWTRARRSQVQLAIVLLDVDLFKQYNDQYGHALGDTCLKRIAQVLSESRRGTDVAARIGGEEFSLILPATDIAGAMRVAETIRARVEALRIPHIESQFGIVTVSIGVAAGMTASFGTAMALMDEADKALYSAKANGRNRSVARPMFSA